jgi:IS4 transposase
MSRIKPIKVAGLKIIELAKKLRKRKYAKKSKKNVERARGVRTSKSVKAYNIRVKDKETKIIPVKRQSQRGSTFQIHRIRSKMGRAAAQSEEKGKLPSPTPTLDRLFKGDVQRGKLDDYRLTRMYLRNKLSDVAKKKFKGGIMNKKN